jgi:hypothetical protein
MKNLNLNEVQKLEHCECDEVCLACKEKYEHMLDQASTDTTNNAVVNTLSGTIIGDFVYNKSIPKKPDLLEMVLRMKSQILEIEDYLRKSGDSQ